MNGGFNSVAELQEIADIELEAFRALVSDYYDGLALFITSLLEGGVPEAVLAVPAVMSLRDRPGHGSVNIVTWIKSAPVGRLTPGLSDLI